MDLVCFLSYKYFGLLVYILFMIIFQENLVLNIIVKIYFLVSLGYFAFKTS